MSLFLGNQSIKQRLMNISLLTTLLTLCLASAVVLTNEYFSVRVSLVENLTVQARMIGSNSTAAISFSRPSEAKEMLSALSASPNIVMAVIYTNDDKVFAKYQNSQKKTTLKAPSVLHIGADFSGDSLHVVEPIVLDNEVIGSIYLQSDLTELRQRLWRFVQGVIGVAACSLLAAYWLLTRLQRSITLPILNLSSAVETVSREKNFKTRVEIHYDDEIGTLARGFNEMLGQLQLRDNELSIYRQNLEQLVESRTAELERANILLQQQLQEKLIAEQDLLRTTEKLALSNQELQEFAYIASHDLQEPLRKVQSFGDRLKQKYGDVLTGQGKEYLDRMQNSASRMQVLIQSLLAYSRINSKAQPFEMVDLNLIIKDVLSDLEVLLDQVSGRVQVENLGCVQGDAVQLRQLFQNLISNALKFHRHGIPPVVDITTNSGLYNDEASGVVFCEIKVSDNGIGFEQKYAERIFGIFQRLHGRSEYEGTGIGLAVCRKIVDRHGGTIAAQSTPDEGATFIIRLPMEHKHE